MAILSKPGGGMLSDSLVTGTPLLFSEELAGYERDNRQLWIEAGFGMAFEDFIEHPDRDHALQEMQERLKLQAAQLPTVMECLNKKETNTL